MLTHFPTTQVSRVKKYRIFLSEAFFSASSLPPPARLAPRGQHHILSFQLECCPDVFHVSLSFLEDSGSLTPFPIGGKKKKASQGTNFANDFADWNH